MRLPVIRRPSANVRVIFTTTRRLGRPRRRTRAVSRRPFKSLTRLPLTHTAAELSARFFGALSRIQNARLLMHRLVDGNATECAKEGRAAARIAWPPAGVTWPPTGWQDADGTPPAGVTMGGDGSPADGGGLEMH